MSWSTVPARDVAPGQVLRAMSYGPRLVLKVKEFTTHDGEQRCAITFHATAGEWGECIYRASHLVQIRA